MASQSTNKVVINDSNSATPGLNTDTSTKAAPAEVAASLEKTIQGKKDLLGSFSKEQLEQTLEAISRVLERDPRLEGLFAIQESPLSKLSQSNVQLPDEFTQGLNQEQINLFKNLVAFYGSYMAPFPDPTETEPLASLIGYMTDPDMDWDMTLGLTKEGAIIGAICSQNLSIELKNGKSLDLTWNEHVYMEEDSRSKGIGSDLYQRWEIALRKSSGTQAIFIEIDNPYALATDAVRLNHENNDPVAVAERARLWKEDGQSMDPFGRLKFWGGNGYRVMAFKDTDGKYCAVPYVQISMDPANLESPCETLWAGIKVVDPDLLQNGAILPGDVYRAMFSGLQSTIDDRLDLYPEYVRTAKQLKGITEIVLLDPNTDEGREAMRNLADKRDETTEAKFDAAYCKKELKNSARTDEEREILQFNLQRALNKLAESSVG